MKFTHRSGEARQHPEISALIPWYVNGTLDEREAQRVEAHLALCAMCREDLAQERYVYRGMNSAPFVEHIPAASLKRLQAQLDGAEAAPPAVSAANGRPAAEPARRALPWQGWMAASVALMAVALGLVAADRWLPYRARVQPDYYTVTAPIPRPPNEVIRAVFSPHITLVEMQAILDEAQLRIVSGPTEAGVYSLAADSHRPVNESLALLRGHAQVRFAESTVPGAGDP